MLEFFILMTSFPSEADTSQSTQKLNKMSILYH